MNKQELIEKVEEGKYANNRTDFESGYNFASNNILEQINKLDEPQKVKVPPVVAVWYEINKDNLYKNIAYLCANWVKSTTDDTLFNWMSNTDNFIQILVNMHQFGYEVEKEKRYLVKMKGIDTNFNFLNRHRNENYWIFSSKDKNTLYQTQHTRKELEEADFGWVFDCPGIEIEEVPE